MAGGDVLGMVNRRLSEGGLCVDRIACWPSWATTIRDSASPKGGQPSKRFVLADGTLTLPRVDGVDVDNTPARGPGSGGSVNVNAVNAPDDDSGIPDGEQPPAAVLASDPEADRAAPDDDGAWGEL